MKSKHKVLVIRYGFILLIVVFFIFFLRDIDFSQLSGISLSWPYLFAASIVALFFRYWGVFIWRSILVDLGAKKLPRFSELSNVYSKAWLGRYIPGSVTWIAGKIYFASSIGISKSRLTIASTIEALVQIASITTVSLLLVGLDGRTDEIPFAFKILLLMSSVVLITFLHPSVFNRIVGFIFKKLKKQNPHDELQTNKKAVVRSFFLYAFGAFISGTSYFLLTKSLDQSTPLDLFFYIVGVYNLAGVLGMLTPIVPSGLGVRDGVLLVLLSIVLPKETALLLTVLSRLWSAIIDVLFFIFTNLYVKYKLNKLLA